MALRLVQFIVVVVALLACVSSTRAASGRIGFNGGCGGDICGFDAIGLLDSGGAEVTVGGHITCDPRLQEGGWEVLASVTQEATLAVARGIVTGVCHGTTQPFAVTATVTDDNPAFQPGTALACGLALTGHGGHIAHATQWCRFIRLE